MQSLYIMASISKADLQIARNEFTKAQFEDQSSGGFEPFLTTDLDAEFAQTHGVKNSHFNSMIKMNRYALLKSMESQVLNRIICKHTEAGDRKNIIQEFAFRGYYAAQHNDEDMKYCQQAMLVLNNRGHRLWSDGLFLTPEAGDIVFLDIHKEHALLPKAGMTAGACDKSPMEFYGFAYGDEK